MMDDPVAVQAGSDITNNTSFGNTSEASSTDRLSHDDDHVEDDLSEAEDIHDDIHDHDGIHPGEEELAEESAAGTAITKDLHTSTDLLHNSLGLEVGVDANGGAGNGAVMDKEDVQRSIRKGKSELSKSRQKAHALKAGTGDLGAELPAVKSSGSRPSSSSTRKLPSSSHSSSSKTRSSKSRATSGEDPHGLTLPSSSVGAGDSKRAGRRFSTTHSSKAGSLATPREKGGAKKLSIEDMRGAQAQVDDLPAFCTPRRPASSKKLQVDAQAMMVDDSSIGGPTRVVPKRSQSMQTKWHNNRKDFWGNKQQNSGMESSSSLDPSLPQRSDCSTRAATLDDMSQSSVSTATLRVSNVSASSAPPTRRTIHESEKSNSSSSLIAAEGDNNQGSQPFDDVEQKEANAEGLKSNDASENEPQNVKAAEHPAGQSDSNFSQNGTNNSASELLPAVEITAQENVAKQIDDSPGETPREESPKAGRTAQSAVAEELDYWECWACDYDSNALPHVFCGMCATGRDWICPSCEHDNKSSFNFCGMCGTKKGRTILHKEQSEAFDMRIRPRKSSKNQPPRLPPRQKSQDSTRGRIPPRKLSQDSTGSRTPQRQLSHESPSSLAFSQATPSPASSNAPPSPTKSVATARSSSKRCARPRLPSDDSVTISSDDGKSPPRSVENGSQRSRDPDQRSSRGRGRGREEGKTVDGKVRQKKIPARSRSNTRLMPDRGRDNRKSREPGERDERHGARADRKTRPKRKGEKAPRACDSTSVPAGDRRAAKETAGAAIKAHAERGKLERSDSLSALNLEPPKHGNASSSGSLISDDNDDHAETGKGKSWLKMSLTGRTGELNTADHAMGQSGDSDGVDQFQRDTVSRIGDILATPSIKKRLLKMGGKVAGVGGKLFKAELPMMHDDANEAEPTQPQLHRVSSVESDIVEHTTKQTPEGNLVPSTPSLKKRFLKMKPWGKSEHGKPSAAPIIDNPFHVEDETEKMESIHDAVAEENSTFEDNILDGLGTEIVMTAKDVRPNRPVVSRHPQRRTSRKGSLLDREDRRRSAHTNKRRVRRTKSGEGHAGRTARRQPGEDSDNSSSVGSDRVGRAADAGRHADPLGDRASEAESINSVDFDQ